MKIVHVVNHFMPDFGYQEHFLARAMARLGHEVHVITSNRMFPDHEEYAIFSENYPERIVRPSVTERDGYQVHRLEAILETNLQLLLPGLFKTIEKIKADVVIMHNFSRYETLRLALYSWIFKPRWKLIVDDHSLFTFYDPKFFRRVYYWILRIFYHGFAGFGALRGIHHFVPVADECAKFLHEVFSIPNQRMTVIPLGADCELFKNDPSGRDHFRSKLGVSDSEILVGYIGKVVPKRGVHEAYEIMIAILRKNPKVKFLIAGSGVDTAYGNDIRASANRDGLGDRVVFHPMVPQAQMPALLSSLEIELWPRQETISAIEAAACRIPLVVSHNPISIERVSAGNGFSCASVDEYRKALTRLIEDPALRASMGEKGERFVRENYDWPAIARKFVSVAGFV